MREANRLMGEARHGLWRSAPDHRPLPGMDEPCGSSQDPLRPAPGEPGETDRLYEQARGAARGMVMALVPSLLIWGGLIALTTKLLRS